MIQVNNLSFSYTDTSFISDINFEVGKGEIFGFLGPSGAGKSTLQKILTGVITNYQGDVVVGGTQVRDRGNDFYEEIGVDFEFTSLYEKFTATENLRFFGSLYKKKLLPVEELLSMVGLVQDANKRVSDFSKGMRSRLNFVKALIHQPSIIFLDEPTSGLDPTNSRVMKDIILDLKREGRIIILTTHNMHDAAELCDRVAFIVDGKIKLMDSPKNLIRQKGDAKILYSYIENGVEMQEEVFKNETSKDVMLQKLISENSLLSIHTYEATLEDIFIETTGRRLQ